MRLLSERYDISERLNQLMDDPNYDRGYSIELLNELDAIDEEIVRADNPTIFSSNSTNPFDTINPFNPTILPINPMQLNTWMTNLSNIIQQQNNQQPDNQQNEEDIDNISELDDDDEPPPLEEISEFDNLLNSNMNPVLRQNFLTLMNMLMNPSDRQSLEQFLQTQQSVPLTQEQIENIGKYEYKLEPNVSKCCNICLEDLEENEWVRKLTKCEHLFHTECIDKWFSEKPMCPVCKHDMRENIKEDC
jgi:hypothetical protein